MPDVRGETREEAEQAASALGLPALPAGHHHDCDGVEIIDAGEPLIEVTHPRIRFLASYRQQGLRGAEAALFLREGTAKRLAEVVDRLPSPFSLAVFDGFRRSETVRHLRESALETHGELAWLYTADPDAESVVPPHSTGGTVDLTLAYEDTVLLLGSDFDEFSDSAHTVAAEWQEFGCRHLRRLLYWRMHEAGFVNFPLEWWHYSYGDQEWAATTGAPFAIYDAATPPPPAPGGQAS